MIAVKKYLTPAELSARLEGIVAPGTLANWRSRKPNPGPAYMKVGGGKILYPIEQVEAWEMRNTITPNTAANDNK